MGNWILLRYKEDWKAQRKRVRGASGGLVRHGRRKRKESKERHRHLIQYVGAERSSKTVINIEFQGSLGYSGKGSQKEREEKGGILLNSVQEVLLPRPRLPSLFS